MTSRNLSRALVTVVAWTVAIGSVAAVSTQAQSERLQRWQQHIHQRQEQLLVHDPDHTPQTLRIVSATAVGYNGPVTLLVGIDAAGCVQAIGVLRSEETPGIGAPRLSAAALRTHLDRCHPATAALPIDARSGATMTDKAIARALYDARAAVLVHAGD